MVSFQARDGTRLSGWLVNGDGSGRAAILLHGHGSTRTQMMGRADFLSRQGYAVLLYDARAQGASMGDRISVGWYETSDLLGALDFMRERGYASFGCIGASQGGATILLAADRLPPDVVWVVVESSFPNLREAVDLRFQAHLGLPGPMTDFLFIVFSEWRLRLSIDAVAPISAIGSLRCPVFVMGGMADHLTPPQSTEALFAAAHSPKELWLVPGAGHRDLYGFAKAEYERRLLSFIAVASSAQAASADRTR